MSGSEIFPGQITAGLTFEARAVRAAMPAPEWTLTAILRGPQAIDMQADHDGRNHVFRASAARSAMWLAGEYAYAIRARNGAHVEEIEAGRLTITPDITQLPAGHNARSWAEEALQAVEAVLLNRATHGQESYRINNRELRYLSPSELIRLRNMLRREIDQARRRKAGNVFGDVLRVQFRRAR